MKELLVKEYGEEQEEIGMCEMLDRIEEVGREKGLVEGRAEGEKFGMAKGEKRGLRTGRKEGEQKARLASIKALMKNMSMMAEQAMKLLNIPRKERAFYLEKL